MSDSHLGRHAMNRLRATNSVAFASRDIAPVTGTPQYATDGNPVTPTPPTIWPAYAFNQVQDEICNVITAAGLTLDDTNWSQLLTAIRALAVPFAHTVAPAIARSAQGILLGAAYNSSISVGFTAPANGTVLVFGQINLSNVGANSVTALLAVTGGSSVSDITPLGMSHTTAGVVTSGTVVTATYTISTVSDPAVSATYYVAALFVPSN